VAWEKAGRRVRLVSAELVSWKHANVSHGSGSGLGLGELTQGLVEARERRLHLHLEKVERLKRLLCLGARRHLLGHLA
jgi:hypothetical protein